MNMYSALEHLNIPTDMKGEMDNSVIVGDVNIPLSTMNRSFRHKVNKDIMDLNYTLHQIHLTDIYRTIHSTVEYIFSFLFFNKHTQKTGRFTNM